MGEMNEQAHRLLLEQRKTLSLGGVQDVKSFDENEVLLVTRLRCSYQSAEKSCMWAAWSWKKGEADIEGSIDSLVYTEHGPLQKKGSALARLFRVKMSAYVTRELILLACSIWQGAVLGFWYDLIRTARKLIRHSHAAVSAEDLCYWIAAALYLFVRIYGENSGILRGYLFGGILGGAALYHASFGRFLPELLAKGIKKAGRILAFSRKMAGKKYEENGEKG